MVGDLYSHASNTIAATPLVGDAVNLTHGLVKTTGGYVNTVT